VAVISRACCFFATIIYYSNKRFKKPSVVGFGGVVGAFAEWGFFVLGWCKRKIGYVYKLVFGGD
jgi:hypothetical protein